MNKFDVLTIKKVKLKVEIWADVICPWCYIGKRRFELALEQFEHLKDVDIEWKSFQLNPNSKPHPGKSIHQSLADKKGWTLEYAKQMNDHVTSVAKEVGLIYNFDKTIPANTSDTHRLIQLAKKSGLGQMAEEQLFKAYFTDGKNIADHVTLVKLGTEIGLEKEKVSKMLSSNECADDVSRDSYEAVQLGIHSVPYFLISEKYSVSGAQQPEAFLDALQRAWLE